MYPQYFQARRYDSPESNGVIIKLQESLLEIFTGDGLPAGFFLGVDSNGKLSVSQDYSYSSIGEETALRIRKEFLNSRTFREYSIDRSKPSPFLPNRSEVMH